MILAMSEPGGAAAAAAEPVSGTEKDDAPKKVMPVGIASDFR